MKKGITIQPFIFIMALVVMAFVITFGTKSILDLKKTADFTELAVFVDHVDDEVEKFYNFDVGSSKKVMFTLPQKVQSVCFFDHAKRINVAVQDDYFKSVLGSRRKSNVFFLPLDAFPKTDFYIEHLTIKGDKNPMCIATKGKIEVVLETVAHDETVSVEIRGG